MRKFKVFLGAICCIIFIVCVAFSNQAEPDQQAVYPLVGVPSIICAILLFRKSKKDKHKEALKTYMPTISVVKGDFATVTSSHEPSPAPSDILRDMRKYYTLAQATRDVEILRESFKIAQETTNLDTFCARYDLCRQKACTLLQAEQAGVKGIGRLHTREACNAVLDCANSLKMTAIYNYIQHATADADLLKTDKGKLNRYLKILQTLKDKEHIFFGIEEYEIACENIQAEITLLGGSAQI